MQLKILQPFAVFTNVTNVLRIVVETTEGAFGLLPLRLDCVAVLVPGILSYTTEQGEFFVAVDEGLLVKTNEQVVISVRHANAGNHLNELRDKVKQDFLSADDAALHTKQVLAKLETGFLRRFLSLTKI
ncbi:F0F1 ATP synthase subunit epsilon [Neptunicella marina]|uniref:F0F1 ATP synthase subunit epsilon n=1 Tax=Neptunicella marina TaxID=2125989 RepID=A0A8J6IJU3_9ALTE|nr:F0F1 ATP synthase subunit epsilon [Neptunicella marina]MBC3764455.1 F0F1 ATP synthase subunit epsilon [Neptunicella marina]